MIIPSFSEEAANNTWHRLNSLAKLSGSLGKLEELAIRLAGITNNSSPSFLIKAVVLFAGDHDIALHGLSATRQEVTELQVRNFLNGRGTINAFCRNAGAHLTVVDVGVKKDIDAKDLIQRKIMHGVKDFSQEPAMTRQQAEECIQVGIDVAHTEIANYTSLLAAGEMGIGNSSPASAMSAVLTGIDVEKLTGRGSGISDEMLDKKIRLIKQGIQKNQPDPSDPIDVLAKVGGAEIGAMAGLMLGGAEKRVPCVIDGFISATAALLAISLQPKMQQMLIGSHLSPEPGHRLLMEYLNIPVYLELGMRLGEGTGAALLFPIIDAAVRILHEMATLKEVGI